MTTLKIREEFTWQEVNSYLQNHVTTAFVGPAIDDRSSLFPSIWKSRNCNLVHLSVGRDLKDIQIRRTVKGVLADRRTPPLLPGLRDFLLSIKDDLGVVCVDTSSLQHPVLMYLTQLLVVDIKPTRLFATYAQPEAYVGKEEIETDLLSEELLGLRAVPGFTRRVRSEPIRLMAFLGFEGDRLAKIVEDLAQVDKVTPIVGFPSFHPGWQTRSLRNCMRGIESVGATSDIHKCCADSIFAAYDLAAKRKPPNGYTYALAPLGTRPHSMACALYASKYPETRLIYDHPVELANRSKGIAVCKAYHLSSFL